MNEPFPEFFTRATDANGEEQILATLPGLLWWLIDIIATEHDQPMAQHNARSVLHQVMDLAEAAGWPDRTAALQVCAANALPIARMHVAVYMAGFVDMQDVARLISRLKQTPRLTN